MLNLVFLLVWPLVLCQPQFPPFPSGFDGRNGFPPRGPPPLPPPPLTPFGPGFWEREDIAAILDHLDEINIEEIPRHVLRRIRHFCRRFPVHPRCRGHPRWEKFQRPGKTEDDNGEAAVTAIPPVPVIEIPDYLSGVPAELKADLPKSSFTVLSSADKQNILKTCTSAVKCKEQSAESKKKREIIGRQELAIAKLTSPKAVDVEKSIEVRLTRIQQVKDALLQKAGIADEVVATNDGTFQNDIILTEKQSNWLLNEIAMDDKRRSKRNSLFLDRSPSEKWNIDKPILYSFDPSVATYEQDMIKSALAEIESNTCIKFKYAATRPQSSYIYYVKVADSSFCGLSSIGKVDPVNTIYLSFLCENPIGIAIHETMHALGVNHQQLRGDRDDFIAIQWQNINPQQYDYFAVADSKMFTSYGVGYDYYSIMHYSSFVGGTDPKKPTMIPKYQPERFLKIIGQRKGLSDRDVELLRAMYCSKGCVDTNVYCGVWAVKRLCSSAGPQSWMHENCQKSCGFCS